MHSSSMHSSMNSSKHNMHGSRYACRNGSRHSVQQQAQQKPWRQAAASSRGARQVYSGILNAVVAPEAAAIVVVAQHAVGPGACE